MRVIQLKTHLILRLGIGFLATMTLFYTGMIVGRSGTAITYSFDESDESRDIMWPSAGAKTQDSNAQRSFTHQSLSLNKQPSTTLEKGSPKSVVILTYQRSGSSLVGDMFSRNPDAFYLFEPLDALYVAMYAINHGWSVPSDITHYWNGTHREIPEEESQAVADYIDRVFSCDVNSLPTETLTHNYWKVHRHHMVNLDTYTNCILNEKLVFPECDNVNPWTCGPRFGQTDEQMRTDCREVLWTRRYGVAKSQSAGLSGDRVDQLVTKYADYLQCLSNLRQRVNERCATHLRSSCERSRLRVIKATRSSMHSVGRLIELRRKRGDRNLRVIHSYRDPRAVALSRHRQGDPLLGKHAAFVVDSDPTESIIREARMYCRTVADDFRYRVDVLDKRYPGVVVSLDFDHSADDVVRTVDDAYRFIGFVETPRNIASWAVEVANKSKTLTNRWRTDKRLTKEVSDRIMGMEECVELCRYIKCAYE